MLYIPKEEVQLLQSQAGRAFEVYNQQCLELEQVVRTDGLGSTKSIAGFLHWHDCPDCKELISWHRLDACPNSKTFLDKAEALMSSIDIEDDWNFEGKPKGVNRRKVQLILSILRTLYGEQPK